MMRLALCSAALAGLLAACGKEVPKLPPPPLEVSTITVKPRDIDISAEYIAQTQSSQAVNIQARVSGFLDKRTYTEGSVVNHVAFRVKSLAAIERAGFTVEYNAQYPGVASVHSLEGERIELFDDELATNLGFTIDSGGSDPTAERHNRKISVPIIAHHIHLNVPADQVAAAKEWYATHFGGVRGMRWRYDAVDLPGININISGVPATVAPNS